MARKPAAYTLVRRGKKGIYSVRFTTPDGQPVFRSSGTADRALAAEWASKLHADTYRVARLGDRQRRSWQDAAGAWYGDHQHKRSIGKDQHNLDWLDPHLGHLMLDDITTDLLAEIAAARKAEPRDKRNKDSAPTSQATVDRMLALVRSILRDAVSRDWLDRVPSIKLGQAEASEDYRWLTREEAVLLHKHLPEHLRPPYLFSLATGWREQNVLRLEWSRVDLQRRVAWIHASEAKAKRAIGAPLNREAIGILEAQKGLHAGWVFPNPDGQPYGRANNHGWQTAQEKAGIAPLRWHDLRHTWASWHVIGGTSLRSLMELGGWRSIQSVLRYAHLSPEHLASDAARIEGLAQDLHK